jgi:asparagine synthase (glutamine-hydrolysing)
VCGIAGLVGPAPRAAAEALAPMTNALQHRGPDDAGTWTDRFRVGREEHVVGFGHRRLSILDLSPLGHQPMHGAEGALAVTYNGEIYNFRALRDELAAAGSHFRSECDTEVLLEAFRVWDVAAFDRLVGMFAFALWDARRGRLVLVRDRLGIKPLYYALDEDGLLLFASELHALRRHPRFRPEIDRRALAGYLQHGYVTGPATIYVHVRRLLPGHSLVWEAGRISIHRYWSLLDLPQEPPAHDFGAAVDRLDALLGDAVELRLVADVPLGAFLSGGIDSSAVVALMCERAAGRVRTFSIGFREPAYDEAPHAAAVARHLGTEHTELYVDRKQAVEVAYELPELYDEPFGDASAIPTVLLSRLTRQHVTVALSGDGGDELLGGYWNYRKLARLLPWMRGPRVARQGLAALRPLLPRRQMRRVLEHLALPGPCDVAENLVRFFEPEDLRAALGHDGLAARSPYVEAWDAAPTEDPIRRAMFADASTYLADDILTKVDRASMSVALEARVPILDHRVVRYALSLPRAIVWHGGRAKAPLREIACRRIPAALLDRPKRGFGIPIETLLADELGRWTERYLAPARLAEDGVFDPEGGRRLLEATRRAGPPGITPLWFLLCFQRWFARVHRGEGVG